MYEAISTKPCMGRERGRDEEGHEKKEGKQLGGSVCMRVLGQYVQRKGGREGGREGGRREGGGRRKDMRERKGSS